MSQEFLGNSLDSLVDMLMQRDSEILRKNQLIAEKDKETAVLNQQLHQYAKDMQVLLGNAKQNTSTTAEMAAAYQQAEKFNLDFIKILKQKEEALKKLEKSHLDTIRMLASAAEYKDDDTGVHIIRMSRFSAMIAREYGKNEGYCLLLEQASPMHDIGKIGVPDAILQKQGKLTPDEWDIMRKHPEYGSKILQGSSVPLIRLAEEVAHSHHEKFNGSGYPRGLKGKDIPLSGRIVGLADFFDAVTMDRCYRPAFSDQKALEMVKEGSGSHFDPELVEIFLRIHAELKRERDTINQQSDNSV